MKVWTRRLAVALPILAAAGIVLMVLSAAGRTIWEQTAWAPQGEGRLWVTATEYSPRGIVLTVEAKSGVAEVWRQETSLLPWRTQHRPVDFHVVALGETTFQLLVDYEFRPGEEWLLAVRSKDAHWVSLSPYFPDGTTVSDAAWRALIERAERVPGRPR